MLSYLPSSQQLFEFSDSIKSLAIHASNVAQTQVAEKLGELKETASTMVNSHLSEETILPDYNPKTHKQPKKHQLRAKTLSVNVSESPMHSPARLTTSSTRIQPMNTNTVKPEKTSISSVNSLVNFLLVFMVVLLLIAFGGRYAALI
jgi:hypothetical protein